MIAGVGGKGDAAARLAASAGFCYLARAAADGESGALEGGMIMRMAIGIVAGLVVAFLCVFAVEYIGHGLYPPPAGLDVHDPADQARLMEAMPAAAKAFVLLGWFVGALAGAWTAIRISGRSLAGWVVVLLVIAAGIATMVMIPHPAWMWAGGVVLPLLGGWIADRMSGRPAARSA